MSIPSLPPDLAQFIHDQLAAGKYASESEVVCDAVRLLRDRESRLESLRSEITRGIDQLDRGEYIELDSDESLDEFIGDIETRAQKRLHG
jgi:putative addiction module CopG family antidote